MKERVINDFIRVCSDGFAQGWHERNGGNLSYHMRDEDVAECSSLFTGNARVLGLPADFSAIKGEYFIVTGAGKYMRNVELSASENIGMIRIRDDGKSYEILWGLENGAKPTSELPTHLMNHIERSKVAPCRVIYHSHPANITALTYLIEPSARVLSRILWQSETECAMVFPEGVGFVDWMVPGGTDIAKATASQIGKYKAVVWAFHGIFGSGETFDETFGLVHTIEKAAEIYLKAASIGIKRTITDDQLLKLAADVGVTINPEFIDTTA